jgi:hypothetical protein
MWWPISACSYRLERVDCLHECTHSYCTIKLVETGLLLRIYRLQLLYGSRTTRNRVLNDRFPSGNCARMSRFHGAAHAWGDSTAHWQNWLSRLWNRWNSPSRLAPTVPFCHSHTASCETRRLMPISTVGIVKNSFFHAIMHAGPRSTAARINPLCLQRHFKHQKYAKFYPNVTKRPFKC